jgi:hypothetical protein
VKKRLNESGVLNELRGGSAFFRGDRRVDAGEESPTAPEGSEPERAQDRGDNSGTTTPRGRDTTTPRNRAAEQPRRQGAATADSHGATLATVRRAVRQVGKEAATYRFTKDEKRALAEIVYTYRGLGVRTTENELTRIAVNFLIEEYRQQGERSVLAQALTLLNE